MLTHFVRASPEKDAFFGIAVIRYDGDKTFTELQEEFKKDEHIASVERNASVRLSSGAALVFALNPQNWDAPVQPAGRRTTSPST